jgi:uncharacterized repeat protein (TIGR03803 family)
MGKKGNFGQKRQTGVLPRQSARLFGSPTGDAGNPLKIELLAMIRSRYSHALGRLLVFFTVILTLASAATASWKESVLYSFQGGTDGATPVGGVVFDQQGNLYGATQDGGSSSCHSIVQCGTVYQLAPPAKQGDPWIETVLYVFKGNASNDGASPYGGLVIDGAGNLYGTTGYGGTGDCVLLGSKLGCGAVFELSPPKQKGDAWTETVLYSFPSAKQGYVPAGDLVFDSAGNLYGATLFGGGNGTTCDGFYQYCGAVFELSPPKTKGGKWTEKVLHGFKGGTDGANPNGGLVFGSKGTIYGTTYSGGNQNCKYQGSVGCGTAFQLTPSTGNGGSWTGKVVHRFNYSSSDGSNPVAGFVIDLNGNLYGTTLGGGPGPGGTVFRLSPSSKRPGTWTEKILHAFSGNQGGYDPEACLIFDSSGSLYGTTNVGSGGTLHGSVFRLKPPNKKGGAWAFTTLHGFPGAPDGEFPAAGLVFGKNGDLYSTTQGGGTGTSCSGYCGTVFQVTPGNP